MNSQQGLAEVLYPRIVDDIREASVTTVELAEITGVRERQVQNWASGTNRPSGEARNRLLELNYIIGLLRDVYTTEGIEIWLHGRNRDLAGRRPIDMLKSGDFEEVLQLIDQLVHGAT
jgi:uncharacterized protein (DUF2384 family)